MPEANVKPVTPLAPHTGPKSASTVPLSMVIFLGVMAILTVVVGGFIARFPWQLIVLLVAFELALLLRFTVGPGFSRILTRPRHFVGPLYFWEVIRFARRGRSILLRTTYALLLAAGLCVIYAQFFTGGNVLDLLEDAGRRISLQALADYSRSFVMSTLLLQGAAVLILTPPYIASAISEEKERGTLELLFTTHLHDHEIILGKLLARVTHLAGILLAGLPILSLAQLWGGVDFLVLAAMTVVTLASLISYGSICILISVQSRHTWAAILTSYLVLAGVATCCGCVPLIHLASPLGLIAELYSQMGGRPGVGTLLSSAMGGDQLSVTAVLVGQYVVVHGIIALVCLTWAAREVRSTARLTPPKALPRVERIGGWDPVPEPTLPELLARRAPLGGRKYPISDRPLLWKEMHHGAVGSGRAFLLDMLTLLFAVFLIIEFVLLLMIGAGAGDHGFANFLNSVDHFINPSVRVVTVVLGLLFAIAVAFRAAGTFSTERDQKTLDSLLLLPVSRREILFTKWLGSILRMRRLIALLLLLWGFGMLTTALHPLAVLALAVAMAIHIALLAAIGVWLSLVCRNTVSAYFAMALMLLLLFLGSWLVLLNTSSGPATTTLMQWVERFLEVGLNPLSTWWVLSEGLVQGQNMLILRPPRFLQSMAVAGLGLVLFTLLGLLVWFAAEQRLNTTLRRKG